MADLLRGDHKQSVYGTVILLFTVLCRLECALEPTRRAVLDENKKWSEKGIAPEPFLTKATSGVLATRNEGDVEHLANERFRGIMVDRAETDTKFTEKFFNDSEFHGRLTREARSAAYRMIRKRHGLSGGNG